MQMTSGDQVEEAAALAKEIGDLTTEYEQLQGEIRSKSPHYAALTQPPILSLEDIQQDLLDEETVLLEYALGEERSYAWAVSRKAITSFELPGRSDIEKSARRLYELLTMRQHKMTEGESAREAYLRAEEADSQYWREAATLSDLLLGPVYGQLEDKRLLIVGDGALHYVPFAALPVPGTARDGGSDLREGSGAGVDEPVPLVAKHTIVSLPSASTLTVLRSERRKRKHQSKAVAILADPVFEKDDPRVAEDGTPPGEGASERLRASQSVPELQQAMRDVGLSRQDGIRMPRLLATRDEVRAILKSTPPGAVMVAMDFEASRETAMSPALGEYRIAHFATHGLLNEEHPELSGIVLTLVDEQGHPQDGFLRLHDIYNMDLPVEMVVLSACSTGLGGEVRGEGLVGLVRGFMYAGAERVVASLWKVDDTATGALMERFYQLMLEKDMPPAAALRQAQIALSRQKRWRSPFYWAAFVLQGEWM